MAWEKIRFRTLSLRVTDQLHKGDDADHVEYGGECDVELEVGIVTGTAAILHLMNERSESQPVRGQVVTDLAEAGAVVTVTVSGAIGSTG